LKCPKCKKVINEPIKVCNSCGFIYDNEIYEKISVYFELRDELVHIRSLKESFQSSLENIVTKINAYEVFLNNKLESLSGTSIEVPSEVNPVQQPVPEKVKPPEIPTVFTKESPFKEPLSPTIKKPTLQLEVRVGQKWLLAIGIVTMVFGIGYFLKYSFEMGWIGPAGRIATAYLWGIVFLIAGNQFRKRFEAFGLSLIGGGIATLYFSTFAAFQIYHLLAQTPSFSVMVVITIFASVLSIIYDTKWLAILGLIGGFFTPVMLSTGQDNQIFLMTYMTILNFGILGVAYYKKWDILNMLGFAATYLLYSGWFIKHYLPFSVIPHAESKFWPAIIFLNIFYFIYCIIPFAYQFFRIGREQITGSLIITLNSFIAFGFSYFMIKERFSLEWVSVITILYAIVFLAMASYLYRKDLYQKTAFAVFLSQSALFLIITIPIIFSKHWITIFWATQAIVLLWSGIRLDRKSLINGAYVLLAVTIGKFLLYDYPNVFGLNLIGLYIRDSYTHLIAERCITSIFLLLSLFISATMVKKNSLSQLSPGRKDCSFIYGLGGILLFVMLNIETSSFFHDYLIRARFAAISVLWTLFSVALMIKGFKDNISYIRILSLGLFFITLIKVFLFDISKIDTPYRILSFIILGVVMIGASYLYHKFKDHIILALAGDKKKDQQI
jgi:uncharacterized membrane protein